MAAWLTGSSGSSDDGDDDAEEVVEEAEEEAEADPADEGTPLVMIRVRIVNHLMHPARGFARLRSNRLGVGSIHTMWAPCYPSLE